MYGIYRTVSNGGATVMSVAHVAVIFEFGAEFTRVPFSYQFQCRRNHHIGDLWELHPSYRCRFMRLPFSYPVHVGAAIMSAHGSYIRIRCLFTWMFFSYKINVGQTSCRRRILQLCLGSMLCSCGCRFRTKFVPVQRSM